MEEKNGKLSVVTSPERSRKSCDENSCWHINKEMLPYKMHFFLFVGGMGAVLPFISAIGIMKLGLTASNLAAAFTTQQFLFLVTKPAIGYLSDYFNRLKATIIGLTVIQAVFYFFIILLPNSDMPGIVGIQSPNTSQHEPYKCHYCLNPGKITEASFGYHFDEGTFREVQSCFKNNVSENFLIRCSGYVNSTHSVNFSYEMMHKTCNNIKGEPTENDTASKTVMLIDLSLNSSENHIICLMPATTNTENFSFNDIRYNCHTLSDFEIMKLQESFHLSSFKTIDCANGGGTSLYVTSKQEHESVISAANFRTYQFWLYAIFLLVSTTAVSCIFTISDTACYESVHGVDYGRQRMWGAFSWGLIAPLAGFLNDYTDSYIAAWCLMAFLCSLQIWNLSKMNLVKPDFSQNMLKDIKTVFSSMEFLAFETGVLLNGMFTGVIWFYLTWFIATIDGNKLIIGLVHTIQCYFGEVPAMFFSNWLIKKLGHFNLVSLALFSHGLRFLLYSFVYNPWWILPIECLHGFTFGSFYAAMTSYGKLNSKPGTEATTQSVLCATFEALGCGLGCVVSGICFENYGGHSTFFYASFLCAMATAVNVLFTFLIRCKKGGLDVSGTTSSTGRY